MHRDTKLGLALAILVMGFAAALCFPRETEESVAHLENQLARELDSAIRHKPVKPYTESDRPAAKAPPVVAVPTESVDIQTESPGPDSHLPVTEEVTSVPDPMPVPGEQEPTPVNPGSLPAEVIAEQDAEPVIPTKTYTVLPGDTLSGIADRHLGSASPWAVDLLFEANRHQLSNKDSVVPEMELVIPILEGREAIPASEPRSSIAETASPPAPKVGQTAPVTPAPRKRFGGTRIGAGGSPRIN